MNEEIAVSWLNKLSAEAAVQEFHKCCGAAWWCDRMTQARPFADATSLQTEADCTFDDMLREAWLEAFGSHPKIGDLESLRMRLAGNKQWSAGEQAGVESCDEETLNRLATGNLEYEQRFGYVFILCATGLSAAEMLAQLERRLHNDDVTELHEASDQQRKITHLRLKKLEGIPMSPITTHVLDTAIGSPAEGITVTLYQVKEDEADVEVGRAVTNSDGRAADLLPEGTPISGTYRIEFTTAEYFAKSDRRSFYPRVDVLFEVETDGGHYHVPLLLSPFGYSTYRGS